jgi:hypothetical protein
MSTVTPSTKWRLRDVVDDASLTGSVRIVAHAVCKQRNLTDCSSLETSSNFARTSLGVLLMYVVESASAHSLSRF